MNDMFEAEPPLKAPDTQSLVCRVDIELPPLSLSGLVRRGRGTVYRIGRMGPVGFSIERPGLFTGHGQAERVEGWLSLNSADATIAAMELEVDPASVALRWTDTVAGERPIHGLPRLHFRSSASLGSSAGTGLAARSTGGVLRGLLDIDGTPRLQTMDVTLPDRARDSITGTEIVSYRLDGEIDLVSFALPPQGSLLGDAIVLTLRVDVEISPGD